MANSFTFSISGDATSAIAVLDKFQAKLKDTGTEAEKQTPKLGEMDKGIKGVGESSTGTSKNLSGMLEGLISGGLSIDGITGSLLKAGLGFGVLGGIGAAAAEKVIGGVVSMAEEIPKAIEATDNLVEQYKELHITAGLSIADFNALNATLELSGGKAEDITSIVSGMQKAIKKNSENLVENGVAANQAALKHLTLAEYIQSVVRVMNTYADATDKDQLLMAAFGKSGMAFANTLKEVNDKLAEGTELSRQYGAINQKVVDGQEERHEAEGKLKATQDALNKTLAENYGGLSKWWTELHTQWSQWRLDTEQGSNEVKAALAAHVISTQDVYNNWQRAREIAGKYFEGLAAKIKAVNDELAPQLAQMNLLERMRAGLPTNAPEYKPPEKKEKAPITLREDTFDADKLRMEQESLANEHSVTLEHQEQLELLKLESKYKAEISKINKEMATKGHTMTAEEAKELKDLAKEGFDKGKEKIDHDFFDKRTELYENMENKLTGISDSGLEKRYADIEKNYQEILKLNEKFGEEGYDSERLIAARDAARSRAELEQKKADLAELKRTLSEESTINGGALSRQGTSDVMTKFQAQDNSAGTKAAAVKDYKLSIHWDEGASQGALAGLRTFTAQTDNLYTRMKTFALDMANTGTNALGKMFADILTKAQTPMQALRNLWLSVSQSVVQSLANMAARQLVNAGIERGIAAWRTITKTKEKAEDVTGAATKVASEGAKTTAVVAATTTQTAAVATGAAAQTVALTTSIAAATLAMGEGMGAALNLAASETWAAYAGIPFVGAGLAMAQLVMISASMTAAIAANKALIVAHAVGGIIDQPTLALMGEAGTEIVAPERDFMQVMQDRGLAGPSTVTNNQDTTSNSSTINNNNIVNQVSELVQNTSQVVQGYVTSTALNLSNLSQNLNTNLTNHEVQVNRLTTQASTYAPQALAANGGQVPTPQLFDFKGAIFASSLDGQRAIEDMVRKANYRNGVSRG